MMMDGEKNLNGMKLTFWGTRGSGAAAGVSYQEYGGNTSCVSVEAGNELFLFDAGTGIGRLGEVLRKKGFSGEIHLFLSHLHLDHIQGLPLFSEIFNPRVRLHIYGRRPEKRSLKEQLNLVLGPPFWPVAPEDYRAEVIWHEIWPEAGCRAGFEVSPESGVPLGTGSWKLSAVSAVHPNGGLLYRLETEAGSVVYGLDTELPEEFTDPFASFAANADVLIFDGTYDDAEYPGVAGYGHGTWQQAAVLAQKSGAGKVLVSHHKWERTDEELLERELQAQRMNSNISFAKEGMEIWIKNA